jgi:hypothetical protein
MWSSYSRQPKTLTKASIRVNRLILDNAFLARSRSRPKSESTPTATAAGMLHGEMSHSTHGNPQGSILLDRCTGKTWLLLCIRNDTAGVDFDGLRYRTRPNRPVDSRVASSGDPTRRSPL